MIRFSNSFAAFLLALAFVPAAHAQPEPVVVVTHGFSLTGNVGDWLYELADEMRDRVGGGRVVAYDPATGAFLPCSPPACGWMCLAPALLVRDRRWCGGWGASGGSVTSREGVKPP